MRSVMKYSETGPGGESGVLAIIFPGPTSPEKHFTMAETTKLSVGQALDKLRGTDVPKSQVTRLDEKIDTLDEEIRRLRATRRLLERDQRAGSTKLD